MKKILIFLVLMITTVAAPSQLPDSLVTLKDTKAPKQGLFVKSLAVPGIFILYGFTSLEVEPLDNINEKIKRKIGSNYPGFRAKADDYLMFAPSAGLYLLEAAGLKGKHNLKDKSIIYGMGLVIMNTKVHSLKKITNELRPDGSKFNSFPSGHTAMAFLGAEILRIEYGHRSPWFGIAGYTIATTTGVLRMLNNKHWFSDVVAGAGFGILSAKLSYWIFSKIEKKRNQKPININY